MADKRKIREKHPQDPAPASAQQEVDPETDVDELVDDASAITIVYDGETYRVDTNKVNDIEVLEAFQRGSAFLPPELNGALTALQKSLGPDYAKFKEDQRRKHGTCSATAIFELFGMVDQRAGGNS